VDIAGKRVLVTGGSRGIGAALARGFAAAGASVAVAARSEADLRSVADEVGGRAFVVDLLDPAQAATLLHRVEDDAGPVDLLVNNAGVGAAGALWQLPAEEIERTVRLNLTVPLELCRQAIPRMLRRGGGHIVNVASLAALAAVPGMTHYAGSKAGLAHASAALRDELRGLPIGVTTVLVGGVPTELLRDGEASYAPFHKGFQRLRRVQLVPDTAPEALADAVVRGVAKDRRNVWLPKRAAPFVALVETPRRIVEAVLVGVPRRAS
jgi:short-subunit dehydrogenase